MSLSIISVNAKGLRNNVKRKAIFLFCKQFKTDFCFIQESHSAEQDKSFWRSQWGDDLWMSHGTEHSAGVCILKNRFNGKVLISDCDNAGYYIFLILEAAHSIYISVNVYGFSRQTENKLYFDRLEERLLHWLFKYPDSFIILGGDFITLWIGGRLGVLTLNLCANCLTCKLILQILGGTLIQLKESIHGATRHRPVTHALIIGLLQKT